MANREDSHCLLRCGSWYTPTKKSLSTLSSLLGLAHIFHAGFITPKQKFWCNQVLDAAGEEISPPWSVEYNSNTTLAVWPGHQSYSRQSSPVWFTMFQETWPRTRRSLVTVFPAVWTMCLTMSSGSTRWSLSGTWSVRKAGSRLSPNFSFSQVGIYFI